MKPPELRACREPIRRPLCPDPLAGPARRAPDRGVVHRHYSGGVCGGGLSSLCGREIATKRGAPTPSWSLARRNTAGRPSPVYRARLDHAYELFKRGLAPMVITTGGAGADPKFTEGGVGRDYLSHRGIPDSSLIAETQGAATPPNRRNASAPSCAPTACTRGRRQRRLPHLSHPAADAAATALSPTARRAPNRCRTRPARKFRPRCANRPATSSGGSIPPGSRNKKGQPRRTGRKLPVRRSEDELQRELQLPGRAGIASRDTCRTDHAKRVSGAGRRVRVRIAEVGMVEQVEDLHAELVAQTLGDAASSSSARSPRPRKFGPISAFRPRLPKW